MEIEPRVEGNFEKRLRSAALDTALAVDLEVAQEHAQWWNPELEPRLVAHRSSLVEGVDGAASAWIADECNRASGQELAPEKETQHAEVVQQAKNRELDVWKQFGVSDPRPNGSVPKQIAQARWVLT